MVTKFDIIKPPHQLKDYVLYYWVFEGEASRDLPYTHKMLPNGFSEVIGMYKGSYAEGENGKSNVRSPTVMVTGQMDKPISYRLEEDFGIFGACLYPYTLSALFSVNGVDLKNRHLRASHFIPAGTSCLESFSNAKTNQERMTHISNFFSQTLDQTSGENATVFEAIRSLLKESKAKVRQVAEEHGLSPRHLQRQCKKFTGFTPKQLLRISRIQRALNQPSPQSLTALAMDLEYYDQSHFIQDFKEITGLTPGDYYGEIPMDLRWQYEGERIEPVDN